VRVLGLDIGSRTVDAVWLEGSGDDDARVVESVVLDSGPEPHGIAARLAARGDHDVLVATGYGRRAAHDALGALAITEIKAFALGATHLHPEVASILDMGGQDTKAIALSTPGVVEDFEMNDRCAAGTGCFLEVMAAALGMTMDEFGQAALRAQRGLSISSMCTVFAESEVVGLLHRGEDRAAIARGLHDAIAKRAVGMLKRAGARSPLLFAGGVARDPAMATLVAAFLGGRIVVADHPQLVGATGAALYGLRR
jgi:(R)-2-hydroxyacyl-CoA dehydratese activating ATPase